MASKKKKGNASSAAAQQSEYDFLSSIPDITYLPAANLYSSFLKDLFTTGTGSDGPITTIDELNEFLTQCETIYESTTGSSPFTKRVPGVTVSQKNKRKQIASIILTNLCQTRLVDYVKKTYGLNPNSGTVSGRDSYIPLLQGKSNQGPDGLQNLSQNIFDSSGKTPEEQAEIERIERRIGYFTSKKFVEQFESDVPTAGTYGDTGSLSDKLKSDGDYGPYFKKLFKTTAPIDWRSDLLTIGDNDKQCLSAMGDDKAGQGASQVRALQNAGKLRCYICGTIISRADTAGVEKSQCEHVLPIISALANWWLVKHTPSQYSQALYSDVGFRGMKYEYDWSHACCNQIKNSYEMTIFTQNKSGVMLCVPHDISIVELVRYIVRRGEDGSASGNSYFDCSAIYKQYQKLYNIDSQWYKIGLDYTCNTQNVIKFMNIIYNDAIKQGSMFDPIQIQDDAMITSFIKRYNSRTYLDQYCKSNSSSTGFLAIVSALVKLRLRPLTVIITENIQKCDDFDTYTLLQKFKMLSAFEDKHFMAILLDLDPKSSKALTDEDRASAQKQERRDEANIVLNKLKDKKKQLQDEKGLIESDIKSSLITIENIDLTKESLDKMTSRSKKLPVVSTKDGTQVGPEVGQKQDRYNIITSIAQKAYDDLGKGEIKKIGDVTLTVEEKREMLTQLTQEGANEQQKLIDFQSKKQSIDGDIAGIDKKKEDWLKWVDETGDKPDDDVDGDSDSEGEDDGDGDDGLGAEDNDGDDGLGAEDVDESDDESGELSDIKLGFEGEGDDMFAYNYRSTDTKQQQREAELKGIPISYIRDAMNEYLIGNTPFFHEWWCKPAEADSEEDLTNIHNMYNLVFPETSDGKQPDYWNDCHTLATVILKKLRHNRGGNIIYPLATRSGTQQLTNRSIIHGLQRIYGLRQASKGGRAATQNMPSVVYPSTVTDMKSSISSIAEGPMKKDILTKKPDVIAKPISPSVKLSSPKSDITLEASSLETPFLDKTSDKDVAEAFINVVLKGNPTNLGGLGDTNHYAPTKESIASEFFKLMTSVYEPEAMSSTKEASQLSKDVETTTLESSSPPISVGGGRKRKTRKNNRKKSKKYRKSKRKTKKNNKRKSKKSKKSR